MSRPSTAVITSPAISLAERQAEPPSRSLRTSTWPPSTLASSTPRPTCPAMRRSDMAKGGCRTSVTFFSTTEEPCSDRRLIRKAMVMGCPSGPTMRRATSSGVSPVTLTPSTLRSTSPLAISHDSAAGPPAMTSRTKSSPLSLMLILHPMPALRSDDTGGEGALPTPPSHMPAPPRLPAVGGLIDIAAPSTPAAFHGVCTGTRPPPDAPTPGTPLDSESRANPDSAHPPRLRAGDPAPLPSRLVPRWGGSGGPCAQRAGGSLASWREVWGRAVAGLSLDCPASRRFTRGPGTRGCHLLSRPHWRGESGGFRRPLRPPGDWIDECPV
mmetsp:Transcript_5264/g.13430  ORF Transcript_5264/g.13430 Transcript_5264/m.13430 type:complete len:326 (-) Transcript_5264:29-1006(-)